MYQKLNELYDRLTNEVVDNDFSDFLMFIDYENEEEAQESLKRIKKLDISIYNEIMKVYC